MAFFVRSSGNRTNQIIIIIILIKSLQIKLQQPVFKDMRNNPRYRGT